MDFDGKDEEATHIVAYHDEKPIGTIRMRKISDDTIKLERLAVVKDMRQHGIGKEIMK